MTMRLIGVTAVTVGLALQPVQAGGALSLRDVLRRASLYVAEYERELGSVIAEERYSQRVSAAREAEDPVLERRRDLVSDVLMVRVARGRAEWMAFRDVVEVDGQPVRDREERFEQLLRASPGTVLREWQRLADESARFNIGALYRNFNVPTFALLVLRETHRDRFSFRKAGEAEIAGVHSWVVRFQERRRPTLIRTARGAPVFTQGRLWIDPDTGRVLRTEVQTSGGDRGVHARMLVMYRADPRLGIWVPSEMKESYRTPRETIEGEASYSNFRRFHVEVRLINGR